MVNLSYWEKQSFFKKIDVAIIGSGIVGLTTAIYLKRRNPDLNVAIFERGTLPMGASTRNAGFACFGSMTELLNDLENRSEEKVFGLVEERWKGLKNLRQLIGDKNMRYEPLGGFEIFREEEQMEYEKCADQISHFNKILKPITGFNEVFSIATRRVPEFGFRGISHIIHNRAEGQLHTGEMMHTLMQLAHSHSVKMFFGINILSLDEISGGVEILTDNQWSLKSSRVLVATNGFAKRLLPKLSLEPARNQVLITKPIDKLPFRGAFHYNQGYVYFRSVKDGNHQRILLGGFRNLSPDVEQTDQFGHTALIKNALERLLREVILPDQIVEIEDWWSGIMGVGQVKSPIVEMISTNIGVAVRLGGMGVAIGSEIGKKAAEMLL